MPHMTAFRVAIALGMTLTFGGCENGNPSSVGMPLTSALRTPTGASHYAYVDDNASPGHVYLYALPLTDGSQPREAILTDATPGSIAFGLKQDYIVYGGLDVPPLGVLTYQSTRRGPTSFVISVPANGVLVTDAVHDLFEGQTYSSASLGEYQINVFNPPITAKSIPAFTMNAAVNHQASTLTRGMAFDTRGNLWIKDDDNQTMDKYVPPFSSKSVPKLTFPKGYGTAFGSMVFDENDVMYATNGSNIDVYDPPFTKKTAKAFSISVPASTETLAVDTSGSLYVTCTNGDVYVYVPPLTASSTPQVTMPIPGSPALGNISIR